MKDWECATIIPIDGTKAAIVGGGAVTKVPDDCGRDQEVNMAFVQFRSVALPHIRCPLIEPADPNP